MVYACILKYEQSYIQKATKNLFTYLQENCFFQLVSRTAWAEPSAGYPLDLSRVVTATRPQLDHFSLSEAQSKFEK